jgi:hypothetical protein
VARLEELTKGAVARGVLGDRRVRVVDVAWHGSSAITLTYTDELTGRVDQGLLYRDDEPRLTVEKAGRAWSMDGDATSISVCLRRCARVFDSAASELPPKQPSWGLLLLKR